MSRKAQAVPPASAPFARRIHRSITALALPVLIFTMVAGIQGASGSHGATDPGVRGGAPGPAAPIAGLTTNQLNFFSCRPHRLQLRSTQCPGPSPIPASAWDPGSTRRVVRNATPSRPPVEPAHRLIRRWPQPPIKARPTRCRPSSRSTVQCGKLAFPTLWTCDMSMAACTRCSPSAGRTRCSRLQYQPGQLRPAAREGDLIFRIPTPVFGAGLIEAISDAGIIANMNANQSQKHNLGIAGRPNTSGNDGTITRFGWKAQNKSLAIFSGEAYNVEVGVTNEMFNTERDQTARLPVQCHARRRLAFRSGWTADAQRRHGASPTSCAFSISRSRDRAQGQPSTEVSCSRRSAALSATRLR